MKKNSNFVALVGDDIPANYILKVFSLLSLYENVEVIECKRTTNGTHTLYMFRSKDTCCVLPYSVQVWGVASFVLA